ncbi:MULTISPECIES: metallophosphoesterase [unclassified Paraflavitalea]|uniref:metallophosphoesterase n=1 Tax=unclassified Paraflavitalea TaxID=2798305 RepID=UPI003D343E5B
MNGRFLLLLMALLFTQILGAQTVLFGKNQQAPADTVPKRIDKALNFLAFGDWGRNGADHQIPVAQTMSKVAEQLRPSFYVVTGDNFYPSGVVSEKDPLWTYSLENIYSDFVFQWDWYPVLGNHDYKSNPGAQVAYSKISRRWKMESRYYSKLFPINDDTTQQVLMVFIDTNPLIAEFYKNKEYGPNVRTQDSTAQLKWIKKQLSISNTNIKWKILVGHHPMYSAGGRENGYDTKSIRGTLKPLFDKYGVDLYIAGHEHSLQYLHDSQAVTHHFISGAASESTPVHNTDMVQMAASAYGFMFFSIQSGVVTIQTISDSGKLISFNQILKK